MSIKNYANFDLQIERTATAYRARVLASPAGQATAEFILPFSTAEQAAIAAANWSTSAARALKLNLTDSSPTTPPLDAKTFGARLFAAVFHDDVWTCLTNSLMIARTSSTGLRLRLRLDDAPDLMPLPWEYLRGPAPYDFFALSQQTPIVRYLALLQEATLLPVTPPLRILVLISDPTDIAPRLDVEREWQRLQTILAPLQAQNLIVVERLTARLDVLQQRLQQSETAVHILHFIGHGAFDANRQEGGLLLETGTGQGQMVSADRLSILLYDHQSLRLAFLNACEGARGGTTDLFAGVAQTLVQKRLPAVIAMQYTVTDSAAIDLAASFYQAIANHYPVDAALAEARKALYTANNQLEWGTPVLFMRAPDGMLFQTQSDQEDAMSDERQNKRQRIDTGGGAFIAGGVNTGGGDFVGRDKTVHGDVITADIGAGAKNVAVGKNIQQMNTEGSNATIAPEERKAIEQQFTQIQQQLARLDATLVANARVPLQMLEEELLKTGQDEEPDAGTITRMGDWLLKNAPDLVQALGELFGLPAVGKVVAKAGEVAVAWVKKRFNQ